MLCYQSFIKETHYYYFALYTQSHQFLFAYYIKTGDFSQQFS